MLRFQVQAAGIDRRLRAEPDELSGSRRELEWALAAVLEAAGTLERLLEHDPPALRRAQGQFRDVNAALFHQSWLVHRSITKPRGYAGDHAMLDAIYLEKASPGGMGRLLDGVVLDCAAGRAVRERKRYAAQWLARRLAARPRLKVADLACGPCRLEHELLETGLASQAKLIALDSDPDALAHARRVLGARAHRVSFERENAIRLAREQAIPPSLAGADCILSLGLFDYLPRIIAEELLRALRQALAPGGELLVGNFAEGNPSRLFMEWVGDWPLIYRSEASFLELFLRAGFGEDELRLERDSQDGTVLLMTARPARARHGAAAGG